MQALPTNACFYNEAQLFQYIDLRALTDKNDLKILYL